MLAARMSFFMMHPEHHYEVNVHSYEDYYVPRVGEHVLIDTGSQGTRETVRVVGVRYMPPARGSISHGKEGPIVDILVERTSKYFREADDVVIPDDE